MLLPLGLREVNGFAGMRESLPEEFFDLMNSASGIDGFTLAMLALNGMVGITAQPHMVAMCGTGNTERAGRIGQTFGSLVKRLVTIGWALIGLIVQPWSSSKESRWKIRKWLLVMEHGNFWDRDSSA